MNESVAAASDHRILNNDLEIYATNPLVGAGLALWLPDGAIIRQELEAFARDIAAADGCRPVYSPVLGKRELFERSGHWEKFADDMFPPMRVGGDDLVLRPANCPHHAMIFTAQQHSYRQLPVRLHELGAMFRAERSGVLSGLARVRQICLDDTHVFCRPDQVADEVARGLRAILNAQQVLGLPVDYVRLSLRDDSDNYLGPRHRWQMAEQALRDAAAQVLADAGKDLALIEAAGEAAIYGPKLDIQVRDPAGHEESIATVQLDFNQPERFNLHYTDAAGSRQPVVMIHRGTIGSMERVVAALIEHYRGRLPLWLAPNQIQVLPVSPNQHPDAHDLVDDLHNSGLRAGIDAEGSLNARIRRARQRRHPVIAVIGPAESAAGTVNITDPAHGRRGLLPRTELVRILRHAHACRSIDVPWPDHICASKP